MKYKKRYLFKLLLGKSNLGPLTQRHELQNEQTRLRPLKRFKAGWLMAIWALGAFFSQRKAKKTVDVRLFFKSLKATWAVGGSLSTSLAIELKPFRF